MIFKIIEELNAENGSNYKMATLKKYSDNELLKRVLKMAYDKATYTYGISMKNIDSNIPENSGKKIRSLEQCLDVLVNSFVTREYTGNTAIDILEDLLYSLNAEDRIVLSKIIGRDLKINMGRSNINKVFKDLIVKPVYMRCGIYNSKTSSKINIDGAYLQLKADGTYREFTVDQGVVTCISRSGEEYTYPVLFEGLSKFPDGKYIGELTVSGTNDRATGNGLINSDNPPHDLINLDLWDYITPEEYQNAANKVKNTTKYSDRFNTLVKTIESAQNLKNINIIETHIVKSIPEALAIVGEWMRNGLEGGILKDKDNIFRDGTSPQQLKLKLEIDADVRITGFTEGTKGTSREFTFGAITFENDEGTIKGQTSGFTDAQLKDFNSRREELIGKIMSVQFNDITQARTNDFYALSHPRFIELRDDKNTTDTLERVLELKEMATNFV
jgi:hypothetical protein